MNSPAYDIANILAGVSGMGTVGTDIFIGREPTTPNNCITVYDTGGYPSDVAAVYQRPTIQVRVRNASYTAGYAVINAIKDTLHGSYTNEEGGAKYTGIWASNDILFLMYDESQRAVFTCNFTIHRTSTT